MVSFIIPIAFIGLLIFLIATIMQSKTTEKKSSLMRSVYFYLTSLVTLGFVIGSLIFLFNIGLKTWVFPDAESVYYRPDAESVYYRIGAPSSLYFSENNLKVDGTLGTLSCEGDCTITASQQSDIDIWAENYKTWQEAKNNPNSGIYNDLASALSFLIVALPFFIIHYRVVQKDAKKEEEKEGEHEKNIIRPAYYYFIALASLIMIVISAGMLINLGLKIWVFPDSANNNKLIESQSMAVGVNEKASVQSLIDCADVCGVSDENVTLAKQWIVDYEEWQKSGYQGFDNNQRQAASTIPFLVIGIPLFWYHWNIARSKKKKEEEKKEPEVS